MTFDKKEIKAPSPKSYPRTLVDNALLASYRGEQPDTCSFALFPKLPSEIRIKIWRFAISVPRIVEVFSMITGSARTPTHHLSFPPAPSLDTNP